MQSLPPAEDLDEEIMDSRPIRYSLDLELADYRRLCEEQHRRRLRNQRVTMRALILEALRKHLASATE